MGSATVSAMRVVMIVAETSGKMPNRGGLKSGAHCVPVKKSQRLISLAQKKDDDSYKRTRTIAAVISTDDAAAAARTANADHSRMSRSMRAVLPAGFRCRSRANRRVLTAVLTTSARA